MEIIRKEMAELMRNKAGTSNANLAYHGDFSGPFSTNMVFMVTLTMIMQVHVSILTLLMP